MWIAESLKNKHLSLLKKIFTVAQLTKSKKHELTPTGGQILILEKNFSSKSCFFYQKLQNELSFVEIDPQIKKFIFFGLSHFSNASTKKRLLVK